MLSTLAFLESGLNVCVLGPSDSGKSYLAKAIGIVACTKYRVGYFHCEDLLESLVVQKTKDYAKFQKRLKKTCGLDLLVLDDLLLHTLTDEREVKLLVEILEKRSEIAAYFPAFQMVDMEPDFLFLGRVCSAALAGVAVSPKHVLTHIVVTVHLALLVVLTLRDGFAFFNGFQQLQVELSSLYDHLAHRQDAANPLDGGDVLLDFDLHRWRQPSLMLTADSVIEAWLTIPGLTISSGMTELSAGG